MSTFRFIGRLHSNIYVEALGPQRGAKGTAWRRPLRSRQFARDRPQASPPNEWSGLSGAAVRFGPGETRQDDELHRHGAVTGKHRGRFPFPEATSQLGSSARLVLRQFLSGAYTI